MIMLVLLLLTIVTPIQGGLTINAPSIPQLPRTMPRSACITSASMNMPSGRNSRKADVYINADRSYEYSIPGKADQGVTLTNYMKLPAYAYVEKLFPAGLERVNENRFKIVVPPLKFFDWEVNPVTYSRIFQTDSAVVIESNESTLVGTPLIESLNGRFYFQIRTELSWKDRDPVGSVGVRSQVEMWVNPPPPFNFIPARLAETGANAVFQFVLDALHKEFMKSLGTDVSKYLTSNTYRQEWAAIAEARGLSADTKSLSSTQSLTSTYVARMYSLALLGVFACAGVIFAVLCDRRRTFIAAEEALLAT